MKERIKQVRLDAGLTQKQMADRIGVKPNYVYMMETGRNVPSPATVREICRQFFVREPWLRGGEGQMHYDATPAIECADRVRRLMVDAPGSTAAAVISALVRLDPAGPEWELISSLLSNINENQKGSRKV